MKRTFLYSFLILVLVGCGQKEIICDKSDSIHFKATVIETELGLLVCPDENASESKSSDSISLVTNNINIVDENNLVIDLSVIKVGDSLIIFYDGVIAESYPAQISNIEKIIYLGD